MFDKMSNNELSYWMGFMVGCLSGLVITTFVYELDKWRKKRRKKNLKEKTT